METKLSTPKGAGGVYSAKATACAARKTDNYSVRFWLRPTEVGSATPDTSRSLQVGIRINCKHTVVLPLVELVSSNYERVVIAANQWDQEAQRARGNANAGRAVLAYSKRVREVYDRQLQHCKNLRIPLRPNSLSVSYECKYGVQPVVVSGDWVYAKRDKPLWHSKKGRPFAPVPAYPTESLTESSSLSVAFSQFITMLRGRTGATALSPITLGR